MLMFPSDGERRARHRAAPPDPQATGTEVNHRIANSLTMIASLVRIQARTVGSQAENLSNEDVFQLLTDIGVRIDAVASLHRRLAAAPRVPLVNLDEHLDLVCRDIIASLAEHNKVALALRLDPGCAVDSGKVLPITWIVIELMTNAIKYAHPAGAPGRITVTCRHECDGTLRIEVIDDGVGLPEDFDLRRDGGVGLQLVHALSQQLGGTASFDGTGIGLHFTLRVAPTHGAHGH